MSSDIYNNENSIFRTNNTSDTVTTMGDNIMESGLMDCNSYSFLSIQEQADSLVKFMVNAKGSDSLKLLEWNRKFFCAFPKSYESMDRLFGYDNDEGEAPLYSHNLGDSVIRYFSQLDQLNDSIYFDKYIRININGFWQADNMSQAFYFALRLYSDSENACKALSRFSTREVESVFRFIFDGPHPKNKWNKNVYQRLKPLIDKQDKVLGILFTNTYDKLMAEDHSH